MFLEEAFLHGLVVLVVGREDRFRDRFGAALVYFGHLARLCLLILLFLVVDVGFPPLSCRGISICSQKMSLWKIEDWDVLCFHSVMSILKFRNISPDTLNFLKLL